MLRDKRDEEDLGKRFKEDTGEVLGQPWTEWWDEKAEQSVTDPGSARYKPSLS